METIQNQVESIDAARLVSVSTCKSWTADEYDFQRSCRCSQCRDSPEAKIQELQQHIAYWVQQQASGTILNAVTRSQVAQDLVVCRAELQTLLHISGRDHP